MDPIEKLGGRCTREEVGEAIAALPDALARYADEAEAKIRAIGIEPPVLHRQREGVGLPLRITPR